jgi:2-polyprenyl-3-methyl-5-hydroxy-6-metoxy-1,4-benzoquinol methylase
MRTNCPLCEALSISIIEQVSTKAVITLYRRALQLDIEGELAGAQQLTLYCCAICDLRFFEPPLDGSAAFYARLQEFPWYYEPQRREFDWTQQLLQPSDRVLEVGCGDGAFAASLHVAQYTGLELNLQAVAAAQQRGLDVRHELLDRHAADNRAAYDVVCAFQVLEHLAHPARFLEATTSCLRPGGLLIVATPAADSFLSYTPDNALNIPPHHLSRWTDRCYRFIPRLYPLELVELRHEPLAQHHQAWYATSWLLYRWRGSAPPLVTQHFHDRMWQKLAALTGHLLGRLPFRRGFLPRGHTVWVVYRRREQ